MNTYSIHYFYFRNKRKLGYPLAEPDNLQRAEICCCLCTTAEAVRYDPFCPVAVEAVLVDNFRQRIAMVLVKYFRAGIPACPATDTGPAIDSDVHVKKPFFPVYRLPGGIIKETKSAGGLLLIIFWQTKMYQYR